MRSVGDKHLPCIIKTLIYNIIDCILVHMLWDKFNVDMTIYEFSDNFLMCPEAIFSSNKEDRFIKALVVAYTKQGRFTSNIYDRIFYDDNDEVVDNVDTLKENFLEKSKKNVYGAINAAKPGFYKSGTSQGFAPFCVSCAIQYNINACLLYTSRCV